MGTQEKDVAVAVGDEAVNVQAAGHVIEFRVGDEKYSITTDLYPESYMDMKRDKTTTEADVLAFAKLICERWNPNAALGRFISVMDTAVKNALIAQVKQTGEITQEALQAASNSYQPLEGQVGLTYEEKVLRHLDKCINEDVEKGLFDSLEDYDNKKVAWKARYSAICIKRKDAPRKPKAPATE